MSGQWAGLSAVLLTLIVLGGVAWLSATRGRLYCDMICPVLDPPTVGKSKLPNAVELRKALRTMLWRRQG
jgi:hypothetical protein